ncbi:MAG: hypothetical protein COV76_08135 [Candidatus Omnitrophica bacterium CG11_big_fil_rev_8_21_14_0_20_64_10]|nr:MAG: hypothetical protein COV76_08135 [Candidatus Omnitrophica bacterium CG11_big_fil_rev_8_21_14_0_20_64_10]
MPARIRSLAGWLAFSAVFSPGIPAGAETLEMVTYYPSSGGGGGGGEGTSLLENGRLHVDRLTVGPEVADPADGGSVRDEDIADGNLLVQEAVGIGAADSAGALQAAGGFFLGGGNGDVNGDGTLAPVDVLAVINYMNGDPAEVLTPAQRGRADVSGDGRVNGLDWALMLRQIDAGGGGPVAWRSFPLAPFGKRAVDQTWHVVEDADSGEGWVGIGVRQPRQRLEIGGDFRLPETAAGAGAVWVGSRPGFDLSDAGKPAAVFFHNFGVGNTFLGADAGGTYDNGSLTGTGNTGIGEQALRAVTTGSRNTAIGSEAIGNVHLPETTGSDNTAAGALVLYRTAAGSGNTAAGRGALSSNQTGSDNTAAGHSALAANTSGSRNTALGSDFVLSFNQTGSDNTAFGSRSMLWRRSGEGNTAAGMLTLDDDPEGSFNTVAGAMALRSWGPGAGAIVGGNTVAGFLALATNQSGVNHTVLGSRALQQVQYGISNTVVGYQAGIQWQGNESDNTLVGHEAHALFGGVDRSTAFGYETLRQSRGDMNTAVGFQAGQLKSRGERNVLIGHQAGRSSANVSDYLLIGSSNGPIHGWFSTSRVHLTAYLGIRRAATTAYRVDVGGEARAASWPPTVSDARLKTDIRTLTGAVERVARVRGVSFEWNEAAAALGHRRRERQIGLIAQEVEAVFPELVSRNEAGVLTLDYDRWLAVILQAAVELREENGRLRRRLEALEARARRRAAGEAIP